MTKVGFRHLPVVEEGTVCGMISLRDFIGAEFQMAGDSKGLGVRAKGAGDGAT